MTDAILGHCCAECFEVIGLKLSNMSSQSVVRSKLLTT